MNRILVISIALVTCACIKPPDDGMDLGPPTTVDAVNQAVSDAVGNVPEAQAFHINDRGVYQTMETIFSSTQPKETDIIILTKMDANFFYYSDEKVRAGTKTTDIPIQRNPQPSATPAPTPSPTPKPPSEIAKISRGIKEFIAGMKSKVSLILAKITVQVSTAVGETEIPKIKKRNLDTTDLKIMASLGSTDQPGTQQFFGLKTFKHTLVTNNTSQIPGGKVDATHIEFNEIDTVAGEGKKIHWVYEFSNEVPGLFVKLSECGSTVLIVNNGQVPFMSCILLDTFTFGSNL